MKIIIVGAGGTGGWFIPQIVKYLSTLNLQTQMYVEIYDFDHVEFKNLSRQNFINADVTKNKAVVLANRYSKIASNMVTLQAKSVEFPKDYYESDELTIVFSCVDTISARIDIHNLLMASAVHRGKQAILFDSGNSLESGQITLSLFDGVSKNMYVSQTYNEILENKNTDVSKNKNTLSCADVEQQTYYINQMQANNMFQFMQYLSVQSQIGTDELSAANILSLEQHFDNLVKRIQNNKINSIVETGVITTYDKEFNHIKIGE